MSEISSWVISIAGICFVSIIADLLLPEGNSNSFIKTVMSYTIILVVILPLPKILNKDFSLDIFSEIDITIQDDYIYNINQSKLDALCEQMQKDMKEVGIIGVDISISANIFDSPMEIECVYVDTYNAVIMEGFENINIKNEIVDIVISNTNISKESVIFNE